MEGDKAIVLEHRTVCRHAMSSNVFKIFPINFNIVSVYDEYRTLPRPFNAL